MPPFTTVLFDLGSTLIYFDSDWTEIMHQAAQDLHHKLLAMGFNLDDTFPHNYRAVAREYYRWRDEELVETPAPVVFRKVMADYGHSDLTDNQVQEALTALYAVSQTHWHGEEDAIPTLRKLSEAGMRIGLVSNAGYDEDIQVLIDKAELRPYLDFIISSAACGLRKPHPRIFEMALEALNARPEETVMVGDFLEADILGANRLGMGSVWITRRADITAAKSTLEHIQPARTIGALSELPGVLEYWDDSGSGE
jgi:HAD superfamily hydrolase (TIGR01662 family)